MDEDTRALELLTKWRRVRIRPPQALGDVVARLLAKRGYARVLSTAELTAIWNQAAGPALAADTRPGHIRRGVLEVFVSNSAALQELKFIQRQLLAQLQAAMPDEPLKGLRFKTCRLN